MRMYNNREMHTAVCAECKQECQVPFKPDGTRPVYCRECYAKKRPPRRFQLRLTFCVSFFFSFFYYEFFNRIEYFMGDIA